MFKDKDVMIAKLSSQNSDLMAMLERKDKEHMELVKELTNKIIALSNPSAIRLLTPEERREKREGTETRRFPGFRPDTAPPVPAKKPQATN